GLLGTLDVSIVVSEGWRRCLDRNDPAESARMNGRESSSGSSGPNRCSTKKAAWWDLRLW
ncbi:MAG TPA: hypothetical protein VEI53_02815, partial [Ktedonobacteraceae bacterium]|nr:hypothetical protein [Ktedonobacteraceae bacterium]